ncbi:MAG: glycosyltransferase family 39 protein [Bacteroidales bacterium]|nr:glycosyltransferase family 39 protein [Bacteroidales bacterium]
MRLRKLKKIHPGLAYFPKYSGWVFTIFFVIISLVYNYHEILFLPAQSLHLWRQCDCLSQAMNYYSGGSSFFEPALYNLGSDGTGKAVSDFPVIYYLTGKIWYFTGPDESVMRMINLTIFFAGLLALFKTAERLLNDSLIALFVVFLLFSSPFLIYYASNFLMDVPAFSFALIGMYFFTHFYFSKKQVHLYLFALSFAFAGLLKISSLLGFFAVTGLLLLEIAGLNSKGDQKIFSKPLKQIIPFILVLMIQFAWYLWVKHYNAAYNPGIFLTDIIPLWSLNSEEFMEVLHALREHFRWDYFRPEVAVLILLCFMLTLFFPKKVNTKVQIFSLLLVSGSLAFCVLFFKLLKDHDYYMINMLIVVPVVLISFFMMLKNLRPGFYGSIFFRILLLALLIHSVDFGRRRIEGRYDAGSWQNQDYVMEKSKFRALPDYLKSIGVKPDDKVISLPDPSVNVSLYLMNQKGWTNFNVKGQSQLLEEKIEMGAKYLIISDPAILQSREIASFTNQKIGAFQGIQIFRL